MEEYKKRLARALAQTGALFFDENLFLKDGRPTPYFINIGMFKTGRLCIEMGSFFAEMMVSRGIVKDTDIILGPSYKGSAIACATAIALWNDYGIELLYDYDRKEPKTHGEVSASKSMFVNRSIFDGCRIFVVDDVATSMGTKYEIINKIEAESRAQGIALHINGIGIAVDREQTSAVYDSSGNPIPDRKGKNAIQEFVSSTGVPVYSVAGIREVIEYLYQERIPVMIRGRWTPIDENIRAQVYEYLETYGFD
jgi:orotate phosphoribosyltransferase